MITDCKYINKNGTCGLKGCYAYRHKCYTKDDCKCWEPISNADRIRNMSDEALADFMLSMQKSIWNALCTKLGWSESKVTDTSESGTVFIDWLKQEANAND